MKMREDTSKAVSRRSFIKGVVAGGVAASSATHLTYSLIRDSPCPVVSV